MPASRNALRLPDLVPRCTRFGSTPFKGTPSITARRRSRGVELKTVRYERAGYWMPSRMRWMRRGRSRIFSVSERGEPS